MVSICVYRNYVTLVPIIEVSKSPVIWHNIIYYANGVNTQLPTQYRIVGMWMCSVSHYIIILKVTIDRYCLI
jgi:hypothetical protein